MEDGGPDGAGPGLGQRRGGSAWQGRRILSRRPGEDDRFDTIQRYEIDKEYIHKLSNKFGVVVALDLGHGKYTILGTLNEHNPISVKSWLGSLVADEGIDIVTLGTQALDYYHAPNQM